MRTMVAGPVASRRAMSRTLRSTNSRGLSRTGRMMCCRFSLSSSRRTSAPDWSGESLESFLGVIGVAQRYIILRNICTVRYKADLWGGHLGAEKKRVIGEHGAIRGGGRMFLTPGNRQNNVT